MEGAQELGLQPSGAANTFHRHCKQYLKLPTAKGSAPLIFHKGEAGKQIFATFQPLANRLVRMCMPAASGLGWHAQSNTAAYSCKHRQQLCPAGSHIINICAHRGESACRYVYEWQRVMICQQIILVCPSQQVGQVCRGVFDPACAPLHQKPLKALHKITQMSHKAHRWMMQLTKQYQHYT